MSSYTMQEAFDKAWNGILAQGVPGGKNGNCYLSYNGLKCALGQLISDEEYHSDLDNSMKVGLLPIELVDTNNSATKLQFLEEMRRAHDGATWSDDGFIAEFKDRMLLLAAKWKLKTPIEDAKE